MACEIGLGVGQKGGLGDHSSGGLQEKLRGIAWRMFERGMRGVGKEGEKSSWSSFCSFLVFISRFCECPFVRSSVVTLISLL